MRFTAAIVILASASAFAAPSAAPVNAGQFADRCKADARFCAIQIRAIADGLEKSRKVCLPASVTKDAMAARVQETVEDIVEEAPDLKTEPFRQIVEQLMTFLWPCEPIS